MFHRPFWMGILCLMGLNHIAGNLLAALADPPPTAEKRRLIELSQQIRWQQGPGRFAVGSQATIQLPRGFQITDHAGAQIYMEIQGNPSNSSYQSIVTLTENPFVDFLVFMYDNSGKVDDSDANSIDANELLDQLRANTIAGNVQRKQAGQESLFVDGWIIPPHYNTAAKRLEWAYRMHSEKVYGNANWDTRILGRHGVMSVKLVASPDQIESILPGVNQLLQGFSFNTGSDYAAWRSGDKVAAFGVAALVTGSTTAVATKLGFFQKFGLFLAKFFYVIVAGLGAVFWRFFGGSSKRMSETDPLKAGTPDLTLPPRPALPAPRSPDSERAGGA